MQEIGKYWTATKNKEGGWTLRHCKTDIEKTIAYAEDVNMMGDGEVYVLKVVGKIKYALADTQESG